MNESIKCVVIGESEVGKSSLIITFCSGWFPKDYIPVETNNFSKTILFQNNPIDIKPFDTLSQSKYEEVRSLIYDGADVFIICFSLIEPQSLERVSTKWAKEVHDFNSEAPIILVGLKKDLRDTFVEDPNNPNIKPIPTKDGQAMKECIGAYKYIECSSLTNTNVDDVFLSALAAVSHQEESDDSTVSESANAKTGPSESDSTSQSATAKTGSSESKSINENEQKKEQENQHQTSCNLL
ncbi:rac-like GTP-binding protein 5 [Histomonas meleagridis]|uniref:rac-like GTP-binding protein 5 n=1 Tax=Histomonas meleagridis TaxID=135588 RepID=UPI00355A1268|nr:rac-like GTP-binding protein 5 [Histomonas meleagridis]KAH0805385.1 rac-like GTP-binding protein 5 [Histomonas meleagridis]